MKVWVLHHEDYDYIDVYSEDTDPLEIPTIKSELENLIPSYVDERDEFIADVKAAKKSGNGGARIEERLTIDLMPVEEIR